MGKFLERINKHPLNERAKKEIIMSEAQAAEQREGSIEDHILQMKELIKLGRKKEYSVYLNVSNT